MRFDAVPREPIADAVETSTRLVHSPGLDDFDDVDALAGLEHRQRVGDRPSRFTGVFPADEDLIQLEAGSARGNRENGTAEAQQQIAEVHLARREEGPVLIVDRGDDEIGAAGLVRNMIANGAESQLRSPFELTDLRQ